MANSRASGVTRAVLIFGINCAPEVSGNAPYTTGLAEHLAAHGWDVKAVAGYPHYPEWRRESAPRTSLRNGVRLHRRWHSVPRRPSAIRRGLFELSWLISSFPFALRKHDVGVVVGVVPSLSGGVLARVAAWRNRVPYVLWIQDVMGRAAAQSGTPGGGSVAGLVAALERRVARRASLVMVVGEAFRGYFAGGGVVPEKIVRVRNWSLLPDPDVDRDAARLEFGLGDGEFVVLHSGNMGVKQGLGLLVEAAALAPEITFVLQGGGNMRPALESQVRTAGLTNVQFLDQLPAERLARLLTAADALILIQRAFVRNMALPSKLTAYAGAGTRIVAVVDPDSEAAAEVLMLGGQVVPQPVQPAELADVLQDLAQAPRAKALENRDPSVLMSPERCLYEIEKALATVAGESTSREEQAI